MESSKEKIEAQLCAYIDGELSDAERAEIERHLASNPQHKALIAELRRHSGLLQDLPRASAPLELNEALCGQLERSALLNPSEQESDHASLSINRWPQITAIAAVLMLAIGLGVVVYYVLPPSGPSTRGPLAVDNHKLHSLNDGEDLGKDEKSVKEAAKSDVSVFRGMGGVASKKGSTDKAALTAPEFDPSAARSGEIKDGRLITATEVEELRRRTNLSLHGGNAAFNLDSSSLCLVVSTGNTAAANSQVEEYFKNNRIQFMKSDESAAADGSAPSDIRLQAAAERAKEYDQGRTVAGEAGGASAASALGTAARGAGNGGGSAARDLDAAGTPGALAADAKNLERTQGEAETKAKGAASPTPEFKAGVAPPAPAPAGSVAYGPASKSSSFGDDGGFATREPAKPENEAAKLDRNEAGNYRKVPAKDQSLNREGPARGGRAYSDGVLSEQIAPKTEARDNTETWELKDRAMRARLAGKIADDAAAPNGVIIARMNRRQANELSVYLSREQGQRAELRTVNLSEGGQNAVADAGVKQLAGKDSLGMNFARGSTASTAPVVKNSVDAIAAIEPAAVANSPKLADPSHFDEQEKAREPGVLRYGMPTTRAEILAKRVDQAKPATQSSSAESRALHLGVDPLDEPVDVFIVVKNDAPATVPQIQAGAPKAKVESAPAEDKK